ncbi:hypothetical protein ACJJIX_12795 [Microbulbifer sp. VAAC004]|uniref:hypothetical protein n=1 Tax=unclassified Microbulbifer TaxID=2619833 RepID=UPI0040399412
MDIIYEAIFSKINEIIKSKLDLKTVDVYEAAQELLSGSHEDKFKKNEIKYDEIISTLVKDNTIAADYGTSSFVAGATTFYRLDNQIKSAVFILPSIEGNALQEALRYIALLHELGHVSDFENGKNIHFDGEKVDVVKAEGYAEVFALKHLDRNKTDKIDKLTKSIFAEALLKRKDKNKMYEDIHKEITKYFREKRLRKWANTNF